MDVQEAFRRKRISADEAVRLVKPGDWVDYGFPPATRLPWTGPWPGAWPPSRSSPA